MHRNATARFTLVLCLLLALALTGCKAGQQLNVPADYAPSGQKVLGVPHMQQNNGYCCATNSLGMVMAYYDDDAQLQKYTSDGVWENSGASISTTRKWGNSMSALRRAAESYGFTDMEFMMADIQTIEYLIDNGVPVIANVRARGSRGTYSHAVVVDGYNADQLHIDDPVKGAFWEDKDTFEGRWWANLSQPKGRKSRTIFVLMPDRKSVV